MLAIHAAQERSIAQLKNGGHATDAEVLEISCEKGGTSVLADAFLAGGKLSEAEARFAFDWGVLLQLGDDLQDLRDDLRRQSATLFTRAVRRGGPLDALVNQLLAFSARVAAGMDDLPHATPTLRTLLPMSWRSLIVEAVADLRQFFTRRFLGELERTSPFRLKFLRKRHQRLRQAQGHVRVVIRRAHRDPRGRARQPAAAGLPIQSQNRNLGHPFFLVNAAKNFRAAELMQNRRPVGLGPSVKTWPRWLSQTRHETAVRTSIRVPSGSSLMFSSAMGSQKLGHPVPESNFVLELNTSSSHPAQRKTPRRFSWSRAPLNGRSVSARRMTR